MHFLTPYINKLFCFQEEEQKNLELEMQKRRERIEKWRLERKMQDIAQAKLSELGMFGFECRWYLLFIPSCVY